MGKFGLASAAALCALMTSSASAAIIDATPSTIAAAWKIVQPGDTLRLQGTFGLTTFDNKTASPPITIDATQAIFTSTIKINYVDGLKFIGGTFDSRGGKTYLGKAIAAYASSNLRFDRQTMIGPNAASAEQGIYLKQVTNARVTNGSFTNLNLGISAESSTGITYRDNTVVGARTDGFRVVASHSVDVVNNSCAGGLPSAGAHPDCVQLFSLLGQPRQSDVVIRDNIATGATQGFTSFTPAWGGGERIAFTGNIVNVSFSQGIACYACVDSSIIGNFLSTQPSARYVVKIDTSGSPGIVVANNVVAPLSARIVLPEAYGDAYFLLTGRAYVRTTASFGGAVFGDEFGSDLIEGAARGRLGSLAESFGDEPLGGALGGDEIASATAMVPEPATWAMLLLGFGAIGAGLRMQRRRRVAAFA